MNEKLTRLWATKNRDDEWWSSFVTAPLAIVLNYLVIDIKILTPNKITLISFIVALLSIIFIIVGGSVNFIVAAILINLSHVLDCMDGQMARYRKTSSLAGSFFDKLTDQIQTTLWFSAVGYAAYTQSQSVLPIFLAFIGVAFYNLRGYAKYVNFYMGMLKDNQYLDKLSEQASAAENKQTAGLGFGFLANLRWFLSEQRKIFFFDEGVFIFMLSLSLILNQLTPMLLVFAISQFYYGLMRALQRGYQMVNNQCTKIKK